MNLFVLANRGRGVRKVQIGSFQGVALIGLAALILFGLGVAAGTSHAVVYRVAAEWELTGLRAHVAEQTAELTALRASVDDTLDALTAQMGTLQARLVRLDALGGRLTSIAGLDDGEFNFDEAPAMGGPQELPVQSGADLLPASEQAVLGEFLTLRERIDDRARQLQALESMMRLREVAARIEPEGAPVKGGWISSYYGRRTDPFTSTRTFHSGIDFAGREGMEVIAVADGVVTFVGRRQGYGKLIEVSHGNGLVTRYAHNMTNLAAVGDEVTKGTVIALLGSTGRATGPNLHFEVLRDGRSVDPIAYVRAGS